MKNQKIMDKVKREMDFYRVTKTDCVNAISCFNYYYQSCYIASFKLLNKENPIQWYELKVSNALDTGNITIQLSYKGKEISNIYGLKKEHVMLNVSCILKNLCNIFD